MPATPVAPDSATRLPDGRVAPLRLMDRAWLERWAGELDPRRQPSVSGASSVSWLLRRTAEHPLRLSESVDPD